LSVNTNWQRWGTVKVQGKVIVVTGAGNGMGRDVTLQLLKAGASVAAVDLNKEMLAETEALAGGKSKTLSLHVVDVSNLTQVAALPAAVVKAHGHVDGLINVAGIIHKFRRVSELTYEEIHKIFNVNFFGSLHMVKEFLPLLKKRPEAQILNVSSMGSYVPVPGQTMYGASKAALKLFTEGLRMELVGTKVGVSLVFPGAVSTNISTNSGAVTPKEAKAMAAKAGSFKMTSSPDAAAKIIEGFEGNVYHGFAGNDAQMMDRISRLVPEQAAKIIQKQMASLLD
jgi:NAD(P)-dependent dehydrogenase (short-subunit alcohol dehydrogenase family)